MADYKESQSILPEDFYVSGVLMKRKFPKLFRPKELRQYIFPELGMIMYHLFWIKYTLFLVKEGYTPWNMKYLFFWAGENGKIDPTKGVIYFSLLSKIRSVIDPSKPDLAVGRRFARDWLFKGTEWQENVVEGLRKLLEEKKDFDFSVFTDQIFSSDFKYECRSYGIDLAKLARVLMLEIVEHYHGSDPYANAVGAFCVFLEDLLHNKHMIDRHSKKTSAVIGPNINFTRKILLQNTKDLEELRDLANTDFSFTRKEITILLNRLLRTEQGRYFLASVVLVSYLNPLRKNRETVQSELRGIYNYYKTATDFRSQVKSAFNNFDIPEEIFTQLEEVCFYWELNFFLQDGETIARTVIGDNKTISRGQIIDFFVKNPHQVKNFEAFLETLANEANRKSHLNSIIRKLRKVGDDDTADFLTELSKSLAQRKKSTEIFIDLLINRKTLEKKSENLYSITGSYSKKMSSAIFYGVSALIDWTTTILKGLKNGK